MTLQVEHIASTAAGLGFTPPFFSPEVSCVALSRCPAPRDVLRRPAAQRVTRTDNAQISHGYHTDVTRVTHGYHTDDTRKI